MLVYSPQIQRPALLDLVEALRYRLACPSRDRCGDCGDLPGRLQLGRVWPRGRLWQNGLEDLGLPLAFLLVHQSIGHAE